MASDGEAVAAMSAKAPAPLAAALGFFDQKASWDGSAASSDEAPVAPSAQSRGKGPLEKGGKGDSKGCAPPCVLPPPGMPLAGRGMVVPPPAFVPPPISASVPPPTPGVVLPPPFAQSMAGFAGKGGHGALWMPAPPPNAAMVGAAARGPQVVLPPALMSPNAAIGPDPGEQPEALPEDQDGDGWLELLRDGFGQQFRCENEWQEPPPFPRALHFAAMPGGPCPKGKFPREALNLQLQLLFRARTAMASEVDGPPGAALMSAWPVGM